MIFVCDSSEEYSKICYFETQLILRSLFNYKKKKKRGLISFKFFAISVEIFIENCPSYSRTHLQVEDQKEKVMQSMRNQKNLRALCVIFFLLLLNTWPIFWSNNGKYSPQTKQSRTKQKNVIIFFVFRKSSCKVSMEEEKKESLTKLKGQQENRLYLKKKSISLYICICAHEIINQPSLHEVFKFCQISGAIWIENANTNTQADIEYDLSQFE
ncbi:hypothetical protein RFI_10680 [Reticulomyxa filosa]|uniref:Transmembrane protein n=1 Tax=Reticulomyxa filosa TaxID=46433 RepID=X6NM60_RETFI|nr:hypothetical protein RFI_10680 [Reticulomyxa filosa]|eukprot:ETO26457.1 hypothetical protein RFI_10680 [Reticulomyxa filosa]